MLNKFTSSTYKSVFDSKNSQQDTTSYKLNFNNILSETNTNVIYSKRKDNS